MQKLKKEADKLWGIAVRQRDNCICQISGCGKSPSFAHHIFSRRHLSTRWNLDNGFTICWGHHKRGHVDHEWLRDEVIKKIGEEKFYFLKENASYTILNLNEDHLKELINSLKLSIEGDKWNRDFL